jgi:hypothetical protein
MGVSEFRPIPKRQPHPAQTYQVLRRLVAMPGGPGVREKGHRGMHAAVGLVVVDAVC